ncbi:hypothetical protein PUNSTDRAFT_124175 [Punctularia strigosozonata HHB-11173 SS5]|uniref:uncharacterized protein n=1 Tax=Punctularia strigosozonata (strain HHB-11173) TaxID=741275 RepID=UPI00044180C7|nr:uncharacterized protein PUNSTDRAFT_124175 [Punctularia strigosozonata HHB-11173 SS5]EIN12159.1 hypothetical protein PUNSTDRAFT_124175 [Punctularia strigosozonata HHB-11173 SS5]
MGQFDASLGAILIGTWVDCMLYMWEITQMYICFKRFPNDHSFLKATLWLLFLVDTVGAAAGNGTAYLYLITYWGNLEAISRQYWTFPTYCTATACSALIVQLFLLHRFRNLSRNNVITLVLAAMSVTAVRPSSSSSSGSPPDNVHTYQWVGGIYTSAILVKAPHLSQRAQLVTPVTIWFVSSTACDVSITLSLVWQFRRVRTSFKTTQTMLSRLTSMAIRTGCVTSVFALLILAFFLQNPQGSIAVGLNSCFGRVYALTMLYNLNTRASIRRAATSRSGTSGASGGPSFTPGNAAIDLGQIRVETQVVSDYERPQKSDGYYVDESMLRDDGTLGRRAVKTV